MRDLHGKAGRLISFDSFAFFGPRSAEPSVILILRGFPLDSHVAAAWRFGGGFGQPRRARRPIAFTGLPYFSGPHSPFPSRRILPIISRAGARHAGADPHSAGPPGPAAPATAASVLPAAATAPPCTPRSSYCWRAPRSGWLRCCSPPPPAAR